MEEFKVDESPAVGSQRLTDVEGKVLQYCGVLKGWRPRYLIIKEGVLSYHKIGETKLRAGISVSTFSVQKNKQEPTDFILDAGTHIVHVRVSSSIIRDKWVDAIRNSQKQLRRIVDGKAQERAGDEEDHSKPGFVELSENDYNGDGLEEQVKMHNQYLTSLHLMRDKVELFEKKRRVDPMLTLNDLLMDAFAPKEYLRSGEVDVDRVLAGVLDMVSFGISTMTSEQSLWTRKFKAEGVIPAEPMNPEASIFDGSGQTTEEAFRTADKGEFVNECEKVVEILDIDLEDSDFLAEMEFFDPVTSFRGIKLTDASQALVKKPLGSEGMENDALKQGWSRKGPALGYRAQLPPQKEERFPPSLMSLVSSTVGQDLATVDMPITLSEPISLLQRNCEDLEYSEILDSAAETGDPHTRLALAAIFAISHYAASDERFDKPFTSFAGETYEMINQRQGEGFRVVIESLQKAPAQVALHAESLGIGVEWKYYYSIELEQAFYGKSMELVSKGSLHIEFPKYGDHITYTLPTTCVHNIVFGKMWVENYGDLEFKNHATGDKCLFTLQKSGWKTSKSDVGSVRGVVLDSKQVLKGEIGGNWKQEMHYKRPGKPPMEVWKTKPRAPQAATHGYQFSYFALQLNNEIPKEERRRIAPTDSRFRSDIRAYEVGDFKKADQIRTKLREKNDKTTGTHTSRWFKKYRDPATKETMYAFTNKYWSLREISQKVGNAVSRLTTSSTCTNPITDPVGMQTVHSPSTRIILCGWVEPVPSAPVARHAAERTPVYMPLPSIGSSKP
ncbi:hypothetical protein NDN08_003866 [Rhodosorus marinus]|uniref:PH domain-containing protein n=1 Tax=Rhodosorus marinus TaxID=101924 RepID=A0AAV8UGN4_9RHOD|nr:hypothetical protein NDN08_003866 [Rhodosorus marinus]